MRGEEWDAEEIGWTAPGVAEAGREDDLDEDDDGDDAEPSGDD
jgi:hypothetical protein